MTSQIEPVPDAVIADQKEWISSKLYVVSLYFITVGVLYLWGYWPSFGINILEFLDLTDIVKVTAYPIAITVLLVLFTASGGGIVISGHAREMRNPQERPAPTTSLVELEKSVVKLRRQLKRLHWFRSVFIGGCMLACSILLLGNWAWAWGIIPFLASWPAAAFLGDRKLFRDRIKDPLFRISIAYLIVAICAFSYGRGRMTAVTIIDGSDYSYVISTLPGYPDDRKPERLRYIGHAGEHVFLFDSSNGATVILKIKEENVLALKRHGNEGLDSLRIAIKHMWDWSAEKLN